jgi:hypothetical protein
VRRWAPTAFNAVVALVPASALLSAVGAAGSGYLLHRADIAAAGAGTAAVGLAVERLQTRSLRRRARRDRWEWRAEREQFRDSMSELRRDLEDAHHTLNVLRSRIHTLHDRTAQEPRPGLIELAARQRLGRPVVVDDAPTIPLRRIGAPLAGAPAAGPSVALPPNPLSRKGSGPVPGSAQPVAQSVAQPAVRPTPGEPERRRPLVTFGRVEQPAAGEGWRAFEPVGGHPQASDRPLQPIAHLAAIGRRAAVAAAQAEAAANAPAANAPAANAPAANAPAANAPAAPVSPVSPGLSRLSGSGQPPMRFGPLATPAHLPGLPPGPRDPISGPLAILVDLSRKGVPPASSLLPPATVDAMVWASMAKAEADELTATVEGLGDPDRGGRHNGAPLDGARPSGLVVVGASVVGDPQARARRGRHTA